MTKTLVTGATYVVTSATTCTVTDANGLTLCTAEPGSQAFFVATTSTISFSDPAAVVTATFNTAPALGNGGGGATIQFDTKPTSGSTNAVTSGGLYNILKSSSPAIGEGASAGPFSVAMGRTAHTSNDSVAYGYNARAEKHRTIVVGAHASVKAYGGTAIGFAVTLNDPSTAVIAVKTEQNVTQTLLYLIGAGSPLATTYENGEACLGYVVKDTSGNILACGTRKLSEILTNNTAFAPASLDLDAPAPTPFLPTGIMEPIEMPEDLTE